VFAGAAREAVFSQPDVIRRINADFIPVALKAALVNKPPPGPEGRLYAEIARSKLAPQGICVVNSACQVLAWALMFDDEKSVLGFLDHTAARFRDFPDGTKAIAAQRFMRFPSEKLADVQDDKKPLPIPAGHANAERCPAEPPLPNGAVLVRVFGRALDKDGKPVGNSVRQEHYVEDRFHIPVHLQEALVKQLRDAADERFVIADDLAEVLVSHAYLGQLDVNPFTRWPNASKPSRRRLELWGQRIKGDPAGMRIGGASDIAAAPTAEEGGDGRLWQHEITLKWDGVIELRANRMASLMLVANGTEKLRWGNRQFPVGSDVTRLPAGHPIDLACGVRYGIVGEPVAAVPGSNTEAPAVAGQELPDQVRRDLVQAFGPRFLVFHDRVRQDLQLSSDQQAKLDRRFEKTARDAMHFFQGLDQREPPERQKTLQAYRERVIDNLAAFLEGALSEGQLRRLREIELQQEGSFAIARPDIGNELQVTDEQRKQFMTVMQDLEKKVQPLVKEAQSGGDPQDIGPRILRIRREHEARMEAILTDSQKAQWRKLLGKRLELQE
jgi:hypothetical protein